MVLERPHKGQVSAERSPNAESDSLSSGSWPAEVRMLMSALETGGPAEDQRRTPRQRYRVRAELELFVDPGDSAPWPLYVRDACDRSLGFVTRHRLPLGYGGVLRVPAPDGKVMRIECVLLRCRETISGWYEGAIYFNRRQWVFEELTR